MDTVVLPVDPARPDPGAIDRAAAVIRAGGLVAFPTETVYGLGANAIDATAVGRIFAAKGRPPTNPVIVHVADPDQALNVAAAWPATAAALAGRFWPGPLTLVLPKRSEVPAAVTAGGPTVAVRCPGHPVARALIRAAGVPVAAPSANRSTELSPTRAEHVLKGLNGRVDLVLDGGPCPGGIESTVADLTGGAVRVLRPGLVTAAMLAEVAGPVEVGAVGEGVARSPGQMAKHYSPRTELRLADPDGLADDLLEARHAGRRVGSVRFAEAGPFWGDPAEPGRAHVGLPPAPDRAAALLYDVLHRLDQLGLDLVLVERPPDTPEWAGVRDRLTRAAAGR